MSPSQRQALELFLSEALELCQYCEEHLVLLTTGDSPAKRQSLVGLLQSMQQGATELQLQDIEQLAIALTLLLADPAERQQVPNDRQLAHPFCELLRLTLLSHQSGLDNAAGPVDLGLLAKTRQLMADCLASRSPVLSPLFNCLLQWLVPQSQIQQWAAVDAIAQRTLDALQIAPQAFQEIAQLCLAGLQASAAHPLPTDDYLPFGAAVSIDAAPHTMQAQELPTSGQFIWLAQPYLFVLRSSQIVEITIPAAYEIETKEAQTVLQWQDKTLPLLQLADLLPEFPREPLLKEDAPVFVIQSETEHLALAVQIDELVAEPNIELWPQSPGGEAPQSTCSLGWTESSLGNWVEVLDVGCLLAHRFETGAATAAVPPSSEASLSPKPPVQILVVDDSLTVRSMIAGSLATAGYEVRQAEDGSQAIQALQQEMVDLIICDLEMSNLNGFEFLRYRLQHPELRSIPVVIVSSHTSQEYRQLAQRLGAEAYIAIPYAEADLMSTVQQLL